MGKYRKKPVEVEAVQFTGENWAEMHAFTGHRNVENDLNPYMVDIFTEIGTYLATYLNDAAKAELWVEANKSVLPIEIGEWVIQDRLGFYPCKEDVFAATYEEV
jgi:hypothetical protein